MEKQITELKEEIDDLMIKMGRDQKYDLYTSAKIFKNKERIDSLLDELTKSQEITFKISDHLINKNQYRTR